MSFDQPQKIFSTFSQHGVSKFILELEKVESPKRKVTSVFQHTNMFYKSFHGERLKKHQRIEVLYERSRRPSHRSIVYGDEILEWMGWKF